MRTRHPVRSSNLSRIIDLCNKLRVNSWPCHKTSQSQRLSVRVRNRCNLGAMNSLCHADTVSATASILTTKHLHFLRRFLAKLCKISLPSYCVTTNYKLLTVNGPLSLISQTHILRFISKLFFNKLFNK